MGGAKPQDASLAGQDGMRDAPGVWRIALK